MEFDKSDDDLVKEFQKGSMVAFEHLVSRYQFALVNFFYHQTYNKVIAEDYAQDVFMKLFLALGTYTPAGKFKYFLFRIARNYLIDKKREKKRKEVSLSHAIDESGTELQDMVVVEDTDERGFLSEKVALSLLRLPEEHRTVIILSEYCNMDYREISEILGIPVGTIKSRMHNAILKLKEILGNIPV